MIFKLYRALKASRYWVSARQLASQERYSESLRNIDLCEKYSRVVDEDILIMKFFLLSVLGLDENRRDYLRKSLEYIKSNEKLNLDEKKYLVNYLSYVSSKVDDETEFEFHDYVESNVASHYKENFPYKKNGR